MRYRCLILILFVILLPVGLLGCSQPTAATPTVGQLAITPTTTALPTVESTRAATETAVPSTPTASPTQTATPTATFTPTPVPSPTLSLWDSLQNVENDQLKVVNQIGGRINTVTVQDTIAYLGVGPRLWTLDVADPVNPVELGQSDILPGIVKQIAISGSIGYVVTDKQDGFWIFDLSEPANPLIRSFFEIEERVNSLQVRNGRLYVATNNTAQVFDIKNAALPNPIGILPPHYWLLPNSNYIYTVDIESDKTVLSVADDADLNKIEEISILRLEFEVYPAGFDNNNFYFVNYDRWPKLLKVRQIGLEVETVELDVRLSPIGFPQIIDNDTLYSIINFEGAGSIEATNIAENGAFRQRSLSAGRTVYDLFIEDEMIFVAAGNKLLIADSKELNILSEWRSTGDLSWLHINERQLFINAGLDDDRIYEFAIDQQEKPNLVHEQGIEFLGNEIALKDSLLLASGWFRGIHFFDLDSYPWQNLTIYNEGPRTTIESVHDMHLSGNYLYAMLDEQFTVLDVSDPQNVRLTSTVEEISFATEIAAVDETLFIWSQHHNQFWGLQSFSLTNPAQPKTLSSWPDPLRKYIFEWLVKKDQIYLLSRSCEAGNNENTLLRVLDVSQPDNMTLEASVCLPFKQNSLLLEGNTLFVGGETLLIFDVAEIQELNLIGEIDTPGAVLSLVTIDNFVYVADGEGGLLILKSH